MINERIGRDGFRQDYEADEKTLEGLEAQQARLITQQSQQEVNFTKMKESFHEILNLWNDWEELTDEGKQIRLQTIVEGVTVTKEHIDIDLIVEGKVLSHLRSHLEHKITYLSEPVKNLLQGHYSLSIALSQSKQEDSA